MATDEMNTPACTWLIQLLKKQVKSEAYVLGKESTVSLQQFMLNSN